MLDLLVPLNNNCMREKVNLRGELGSGGSGVPGGEVNLFQAAAQVGAVGGAKLGEDVAHVALHRLGRDDQALGNLAAGVTQAGKSGDILFARGEQAPFCQTSFGDLALVERLDEERVGKFIRGAPLALGEGVDMLYQFGIEAQDGRRVLIRQSQAL
jgi:hypothetical protein